MLVHFFYFLYPLSLSHTHQLSSHHESYITDITDKKIQQRKEMRLKHMFLSTF